MFYTDVILISRYTLLSHFSVHARATDTQRKRKKKNVHLPLSTIQFRSLKNHVNARITTTSLTFRRSKAAWFRIRPESLEDTISLGRTASSSLQHPLKYAGNALLERHLSSFASCELRAASCELPLHRFVPFIFEEEKIATFIFLHFVRRRRRRDATRRSVRDGGMQYQLQRGEHHQ